MAVRRPFRRCRIRAGQGLLPPLNSGMANRGWFISFEGSEGCGKSTQIGMLEKVLGQAGRQVVRLREPGGTSLGEEVRHLLKHAAAGEGMCPEAEILLFGASRAQLVREVVAPTIASPGTVVLADRFLDSTTVYQGIARGLDPSLVEAVHALATGGLRPDVTILLDMDARESRRRAAGRNTAPDRIEREPEDFFKTVRDGYLDLAGREPDRIAVVDAAGSPDEVHAAVLAALKERMDGLFP